MAKQTRARSEDARRERRGAFLATALQLFDERPYDAITMSEVAERTGLAKGTAYLYFDSKKDLFLSVAEEQLSAWFDELDEWLDGAGETREPAAVAEAVAASFSRRPTGCAPSRCAHKPTPAWRSARRSRASAASSTRHPRWSWSTTTS